MSEVATATVDVQKSDLSREQLVSLVKDPELRKLRPGSTEYQAALNKKFGTSTSKPSESAPDASKSQEPTKSESKVDSSGGQEPPVEDKTRDEKPDRLQSRFDKLTKRASDAEKRVKELETELNASKSAPKSDAKAPDSKATTEEAPKFEKPKPDLSKFNNLVDYQEALTDWKLEKRDFEAEQKRSVRETEQSQRQNWQEHVETFQSKGKELEKALNLKLGEFKIVTGREDLVLQGAAMHEVITSELGAQIAWELANMSDEEVETFSKKSDVQQVKFIARLEERLESQNKQKTETKTVSGAKPPARSVPKSGVSLATATSTGFRPGMSVREYEAARLERRQKAGLKR